MLAPANRMHRSRDFTHLVRRGSRARAGVLVVHFGVLSERAEPARIGLIVSRAVGASVLRHRVSRRLRAQLRQRVMALPPGSGGVVRALPGAGQATSAELGRDLDAAFRRLLLAGESRPGATSARGGSA